MDSGMRVTQRSVMATSLAGLQANLARMQDLQDQLSSGRALRRPSDNPVDTVAAMSVRSEQRRADQYVRNADDGLGLLGTADNALTQALSAVRRVRDLVAQGANASAGDTDRAAMAVEVQSIRSDLIATANSRYLGHAVFAGTADTPDAYTADGTYQGNNGSLRRTVAPGVQVEVTVPGAEAFGPPGSDLFAVVQGAADDLTSDPDHLSARLADLDAALTRMQGALSTVGARYNRIDGQKTLTQNRAVTLAGRLSDLEDVDLPGTITELQLQQTSYQAALGATARVIQPTLMDFLQ